MISLITAPFPQSSLVPLMVTNSTVTFKHDSQKPILKSIDEPPVKELFNILQVRMNYIGYGEQ